MNQFLIDPEKEFLVIRHSFLNGNTYDLDRLLEDTSALEKYLNGRRAVLCLEGDILQLEETGEVVLTHRNFMPLPQSTYRKLHEREIAASLQEVLDKISGFYQKTPEQRVLLCFEPKVITAKATIDTTVRLLQERGIKDAYFDSFFGRKLDDVATANERYGTGYKRSLHLSFHIGTLSTLYFPLPYFTPRTAYDIVTVPKKVSFLEIGEPVIYGAVGDVETLQRVAENPNVYGAYVRRKEGKGMIGAFKMFWNSVTNKERFRRIQKDEE